MCSFFGQSGRVLKESESSSYKAIYDALKELKVINTEMAKDMAEGIRVGYKRRPALLKRLEKI